MNTQSLAVFCAEHSDDAAKDINCVLQLDTGVLGSIPPRGIDECHTSVFVLSCVRKGHCANQPPPHRSTPAQLS